MPPVGVEFCILDVKSADTVMIDVDKGQIIHLLQQEMRRVVIDARAGVAVQRIQKHFPCRPVKDIFAGMNFIADINAVFVIDIKDRTPAAGKFGERLFNQARGALRPWIQERKRQ